MMITKEQERILNFCSGEWRHLASLEEEIPRSTLYRIAKGLCGKKWLIHRRAKGYKTTQRGIGVLQEDKVEVRIAKEGKTAEKVLLIEEKGKLEKLPVNLAAIQNLLQLSNKKVNLFSSLYPPAEKIPTKTHRAMIELILAEICDRAWPAVKDHHLSFLYFGDTFRWKTNSAKFCVYMAEGEDITPYVIDMDKERGFSLWVRKTATGKRIFRRKILEARYICLEDYHRASRQAKESASHLLSGKTEISVENETQRIYCVTQVNINPEKGDNIFEKTGFDGPALRRFIPCDVDAIELPNLMEIGEEALDLAKGYNIIQIKKPTSDCRQYRQELLKYFRKIFTEGDQRYIDVDGLLNIARGFTGYGFTPSEAVRYVLYKASLPYHTLGWLRPEWIRGFREKKAAAKIKEIQTIAPQTLEVEEKIKKVQDEIRIVTEFNPKYEEIVSATEESINGLETLQEELSQFLVQEEKKKIGTIIDAFKVLKKNFTKIRGGDWTNLEVFKISYSQLSQHYSLPLKAIAGKAFGRSIIYNLKGMKDCPLTEETWNALKRLDYLIVNTDLFTEEQKNRLQENFPEKYKIRKEAFKKLINLKNIINNK